MPEREMTDRNRWIALYVLCAGVLMIVLDVTVVNVALPSIQTDLHFSQSTLAWVVAPARGMASLFEMAPSKPARARTFPEEIRQAILTLKAEHPAFRVNEIATVCFIRFERSFFRPVLPKEPEAGGR